MITPSKCSCHTPRDIENPLSICRDCGSLIHKCRRCNTFYEKTEDSPVFICTRCKFAVECPPSPIPETSTVIVSETIDDTLDEEKIEQISVEPEIITIEPPENVMIQMRDSSAIALTIRTWLTLMIVSMVIGYMITFI